MALSKYEIVKDGGLPRDVIFMMEADLYGTARARWNPGYDLTPERERDLRMVARAANWTANQGQSFTATIRAR